MAIIKNPQEFLEKSKDILNDIMDTIDKLPAINLDDFHGENTVFIIVDMINGFAREGVLKSERVEALIPEILRLSKLCDKSGIKKIAFADNHTEDSIEFEAYPSHCITGTSESELVEELKEADDYLIIPKNSTNGFLENAFQEWIRQNEDVTNFIVVGDCTDICIEQLSKSLKAYFNLNNRKSRVIVPLNAVDTYDLETHYAELMDIMALYSMIINGVEVVKGIN